MTLRFVDSFSHYTTAQMPRKWSAATAGVTISAGNGRNSNGSCRITGNNNDAATKTLDAQQDWIVGVAFKFGAFISAQALIRLLDAASLQVDVRFDASGHLIVTRNGTTIGTGTTPLVINTWYYVELKVHIASGSAGTFTLRVNGVTEASSAGTNTQATGNASANQVQLYQSSASGSSTWDFSDLYVCDGTGSTNNNLLGDVRVEVLYPNGAGANTQWTPDSGSNYARVNNTTPDDDTSYVEDSTAGHRDSYAFGNLSSTPSNIYGAQTLLCARKTDAGSRSVATVCVSGATTDDGASVSIGDSYLFYPQIRETDPNTSAAWTLANLNAAEFGEKLVS